MPQGKIVAIKSKNLRKIKVLRDNFTRPRISICQYKGREVLLKKFPGLFNAGYAKARFMNELNILQALSASDQIVRCIGQDSDTNTLILEYLSMDLHEAIKNNIKLGDPRQIVLDMLHGLDYMSKHHIVHRDFKSPNVLIYKDKKGTYRAKICDFSDSKQLKERGELEKTQLDTPQAIACTLGTDLWRAPETFLRNTTPNYKTDLFSFAMVCLEMLTRSLPWQRELQAASVKAGRSVRQDIFLSQQYRNKARPALPRNIPPQLQWLVYIIKLCWQQEPENRPTAGVLIHLMGRKDILDNICLIDLTKSAVPTIAKMIKTVSASARDTNTLRPPPPPQPRPRSSTVLVSVNTPEISVSPTIFNSFRTDSGERAIDANHLIKTPVDPIITPTDISCLIQGYCARLEETEHGVGVYDLVKTPLPTTLQLMRQQNASNDLKITVEKTAEATTRGWVKWLVESSLSLLRKSPSLSSSQPAVTTPKPPSKKAAFLQQISSYNIPQAAKLQISAFVGQFLLMLEQSNRKAKIIMQLHYILDDRQSKQLVGIDITIAAQGNTCVAMLLPQEYSSSSFYLKTEGYRSAAVPNAPELYLAQSKTIVSQKDFKSIVDCFFCLYYESLSMKISKDKFQSLSQTWKQRIPVSQYSALHR